MDRREFLKMAAAAGAVTAMEGCLSVDMPAARNANPFAAKRQKGDSLLAELAPPPKPKTEYHVF